MTLPPKNPWAKTRRGRSSLFGAAAASAEVEWVEPLAITGALFHSRGRCLRVAESLFAILSAIPAVATPAAK
eukprot:CAMPEP_0178383212 /NCGR_PEP_ID=MMETSP0689_2-20121128/6886_1 /TAXON_ID=160604 /ORGANISM="Amphidinium massartii, Strain CS-259" /LENGTH=71 /DNA_ID=CAMNT_0020003427 /DNA_START=725 /DNA_END=940 /DNA_ORIENTATION=-